MSFRFRPALVLIALSLTLPALAGCLSDGTDDLLGTDTDDVEPVFNTTLFFADSWSMDATEPTGTESMRAPLGDFYGAWAVGGPFPEWNSAGDENTLRITGNVSLTFWLTADTVATSTPGIFPDFVLYFGSSDSVMSDFSPAAVEPTNGEDVSIVTNDDAIEVTTTFQLPPGGIVVPAGVGVRVVTAPVMLETDANDLYILYGSADHPSQVSFDHTNVTSTPWTGHHANTWEQSFLLPAGSIFSGHEENGQTIQNITVETTNETDALLIDLEFTGTTPFPDMDLWLYDSNDTLIARSVTPGPTESIYLYRPNLDEALLGTWTVKIVNYVAPLSEFHVTITTLGGPHDVEAVA